MEVQPPIYSNLGKRPVVINEMGKRRGEKIHVSEYTASESEYILSTRTVKYLGIEKKYIKYSTATQIPKYNR